MDIIDVLKRINRKPQIMHYKDVSYILARIPNKEIKVLEIGGGNGFLTINLILKTKIKKIIVYEKRKEFYENLMKNLKKFVKNFNIIEVKNEEFNENTKLEENFDLIIVDIPYFKGLLNKLYKHLNENGYLIFYVLNVIQLTDLIKDIKEEKLDEIVEIHLRNWIYKKIDNKIVLRPENFELSHTGILVFFKK